MTPDLDKLIEQLRKREHEAEYQGYWSLAKDCREAADALEQQRGRVEEIHILFDGPPGHESGRFIEVEDAEGHGIRVGRWEQHGDYWHLVIPAAKLAQSEQEKP